jgi:DedD protein
MEEHELSDILLEQKNFKNNTVIKIKRLLVITILLILLFVVVLMIMKFINKNDEQPQNKLTQTMLEESSNIQTPAVLSLTEENNSLLQSEISTMENTSSQTTTITEISSSITEIPNETSIMPTPQEIKPIEIVKQPVQSQQIKSVASSNAAQNNVKNGWYIQVSSSTNAPVKSFLDNIAKKGYSHHQYKTTVNSKQVIKVLVGPYNSDKEARTALLDVKSDISKDAFVYQVK